MSEYGLYGDGGKVKNWNKYLPLGVKPTKFPEEYICPLCESKADVVFPISMELCPKCTQKVRERKDIWKDIKGPFIDLSGHFCPNCGNYSIVYYKVNTRICNKCTRRLGKNEIENRERLRVARKIV